MPPEIWVVFGTDQHGERFAWPDGTDDGDFDKATREEAERTAGRLNRLGGSVSVRREVWSGPAAAYRTPQEGK